MGNEWKVALHPIGGHKLYRVYRIIDAQVSDNPGNRDYYGNFVRTKEEADLIADKLNGGRL